MRLLLTLLSDCEFPAALVGSGARWSTSGIYHLEVYMAFSPGIHSFWQYLAFFHVLWHSIWHSIWRLYWHTFCMVFILAFFQAFYLGSILTFYLSGIFSGVHSGRILTFFLAYVSGISSDILSGWYIGCSLWLRSRSGGELWGARGGGQAGNALILKLRWRSGGEHCDPASACSWGPAGITPLILCLLFGVWRRTLRSSACSWGPAGITPLILCLLFGSGGEHCDLALAVEVRRGSLLWSCAFCSGLAANTAI